MIPQQAVWTGFPSYVLDDYTGVVVPRVIPHLYNPVTEKSRPESVQEAIHSSVISSKVKSRKFILDRSVFDLVDAHPYLSLTDPKLLGWYLRLSPEDRRIIQDEGGFHQFLQRHPALELSSHHVYVKYNAGTRTSPDYPSMTSNKHKSRMSGAETYGCGMPHTHVDMEMLPNHLREALLASSNRREGSKKHPNKKICHIQQLVHLQDRFQKVSTQEPNHQRAHGVKQFSGSSVFQLNEERPSWQTDSSSAAASLSMDMELERQRGDRKPELRSQIAMTEGQTATFTYADVGPLQSESPSVDTVDEKGSSGFEDHSDYFYSIMEDDRSILACLPREDVHNSGVLSDPAVTNSEVPADSSETLKSDQCVIKTNTVEEYSSPVPCITTRDVMVGAELPLCTSTFTQTEDPGTSDKHVITEVHMADLDYLTEELIKVKMANEQLREHNKTSLACKLTEECDCIQRAQQAELRLLDLQYSMCRQHCWRLYYATAEGGQLAPLPKNPHANIVSVLQKLECEYHQMRDKIMSGVPLEQLKPLSVDSEQITTGASYIPAQIIGNVLGSVPTWNSQGPHEASGEEKESQSRNGQHSQRKEQIRRKSTAKRSVTFVPQNRACTHNANKQEEQLKTAACKELNTSEAWYDAEEDLEPAVAAGTGQNPTMITKDESNESASKEASSSVLCVSNLPRNVTESDVMLWFEKYHATEVSIAALKNDLRVAIVMISGPQSAKAAVTELNGCCMEGHTLHVEHINRAIAGSHSQASASISGPESSQNATKPQTPKTESSSTERKLIIQPPLSSSIKVRRVVSISPTAKGTCVPQHYGTMGSFDTLMSELTQRHPDVGRQRIVDALIELKTKHQHLSGLPLRTIREMTSELLTRPRCTTQF